MKDKVLHRLLKTLPVLIVLAVLAVAAVWINRSGEDGTATDSSRMVYAPAKVTAVLADNAQEDYENAEGRRVGDQELEIRILSGDHKDEIMTVTNYMSALFNVDEKEDGNKALELAEKNAQEELGKMGVLESADEQALTLIKGLLQNAVPADYEFKGQLKNES